MTATDRAPKKTENKAGGLGGGDILVCLGVQEGIAQVSRLS